jgi:Primase X
LLATSLLLLLFFFGPAYYNTTFSYGFNFLLLSSHSFPKSYSALIFCHLLVHSKKKILLKRILNKTLQKIKETIGGNPTVLWTGNGYHVYQPVSGFILEEYEIFYKFTKYIDKDLTSMFIQFAEEYFTDYTADRLHNPTVKSCLVRIPGSLNSKCISKGEDAEVKTIQKWDGIRPPVQPMLTPFKIWLTQKRIDDIEELKKQEKKHAKFQMMVSKSQERTNVIKWIEKGILEQPLPDHRKYIIWRILSPYLLNVKKLTKEEAYSVMKEWLDKCDKLEKLNFNPKIKIKDGFKGGKQRIFSNKYGETKGRK